MKNKRGFTLVELLAVIVILALIMIIAIPVVLQTMYVAKKKSFESYALKIANVTQKQYTEDTMNGLTNSSTKIYNIERELNLSNTGDFKGYSLISPKSNTVYMTLYDKEYALVAVKVENKKLSEEYKQLSTIDSYKLTPEYLCSMVEECTECSYIIIDEDGNESIGTITPEKFAFDAKMATTSVVRSTINSVIPITDITEIKYNDSVPENTKLISDPESKEPIYIWRNGTILYYSSPSDNIHLPTNSATLFSGFTNLVRMDTTKMRTDTVAYVASMFYNDKKLEYIDTSNWKFPYVKNIEGMFELCESLKSLDTSNWGITNLEDARRFLLNALELTGTIDMSGWNFTNLKTLGATFDNCKKLEYIKFPNATKTNLITLSSTFRYNEKLKKIYNIENLDVSNLQSLDQAFKYTKSMDELDLSKWTGDKVTSMAWTFQDSKAKTLDLSNMSFERTTSFDGAFYSAKAETIKFGNKNFPNLKKMSSFCSGCINLKSIDLSNTNAPILTTMYGLFQNCSNLESVNLTNFVAPNVEDLSRLFTGSGKLTKVDLSSLNSTKVINMDYAFSNMGSLREIDISGIKSNKVESMTSTFQGSTSLTTIYASSAFSNESVLSDKKIATFWNCPSLPGFSSTKTTANYAKSTSSGGYFTIK